MGGRIPKWIKKLSLKQLIIKWGCKSPFIKTNIMKQSNCCGARNWLESGICEQCKEHADFSDWEEEANERMKIIGQNGNSGIHYTKEIIL